jgi:hypothetical protein
VGIVSCAASVLVTAAATSLRRKRQIRRCPRPRGWAGISPPRAHSRACRRVTDKNAAISSPSTKGSTCCWCSVGREELRLVPVSFEEGVYVWGARLPGDIWALKQRERILCRGQTTSRLKSQLVCGRPHSSNRPAPWRANSNELSHSLSLDSRPRAVRSARPASLAGSETGLGTRATADHDSSASDSHGLLGRPNLETSQAPSADDSVQRMITNVASSTAA